MPELGTGVEVFDAGLEMEAVGVLVDCVSVAAPAEDVIICPSSSRKTPCFCEQHVTLSVPQQILPSVQRKRGAQPSVHPKRVREPVLERALLYGLTGTQLRAIRRLKGRVCARHSFIVVVKDAKTLWMTYVRRIGPICPTAHALLLPKITGHDRRVGDRSAIAIVTSGAIGSTERQAQKDQ
jgi:hypothetical protein